MKFWIALSEQVEDGWVQILSPGKVKHPLHGTIDLNPTRFQKFVDNFKAKVRGTDLDVDYDHKMDPAKGRQAAGWFKDLRADDTGLWALVDWTDEAKEDIKSKKYRYLSADFYDKWTDQEGKVHKDVIAGAALTNRPFLKNMLPVNLSEILDTESEDSMDPELRKALIGKYKLSDNATDADIQAAVTADTPPAVDVSKAAVKWNEDGTGTVTIPGVDGEVKLTAPEPNDDDDDDDDVKKLAESNPAIAKLLADREEDRKRLKVVENANRLTEVNTQLNDIGGLPPVVLSELREAFVGAPKTFTDKIVDALGKLKKGGFVPEGQISKTGGPSGDPDGNSNAIKQFMDAADKLKADNPKLSEADVYTKLAAEQPDLYRAYDRAVQATEEFEEVN